MSLSRRGSWQKATVNGIRLRAVVAVRWSVQPHAYSTFAPSCIHLVQGRHHEEVSNHRPQTVCCSAQLTVLCCVRRNESLASQRSIHPLPPKRFPLVVCVRIINNPRHSGPANINSSARRVFKHPTRASRRSISIPSSRRYPAYRRGEGCLYPGGTYQRSGSAVYGLVAHLTEARSNALQNTKCTTGTRYVWRAAADATKYFSLARFSSTAVELPRAFLLLFLATVLGELHRPREY